MTKELETLKAENKTLRNEILQKYGENEEELLSDKAKIENLIQKLNKVEDKVTDSLGSMEETLKRDIKTYIKELTDKLDKLEEKFNSDSKTKDVSLKALVNTLEEQSDILDKMKKDITKKLTKQNEDEQIEELRIELTKGNP